MATSDTLQRSNWNGTAIELETLWTLTKGETVARMALYTHQLGWEMRVIGPGILMTKVCKVGWEIEEVWIGWKRGILQRGWR